jgi:hypothetical protein
MVDFRRLLRRGFFSMTHSSTNPKTDKGLCEGVVEVIYLNMKKTLQPKKLE